MSAVVLLAVAFCVFALAYRYSTAFLAARVLMLDDRRVTPAILWILSGSVFAGCGAPRNRTA